MSSEPEIARCGLCGEPMPAGEEMFNYHGYSGPCPTPAPKPPQKATCETHGHIYGHEGVCLFCRTPKPTQAPQTVCEWREDEKGIWRTRCNSVELSSDELHNGPGIHWNDCPYCGKPLKLAPESPNEGAK